MKLRRLHSILLTVLITVLLCACAAQKKNVVMPTIERIIQHDSTTVYIKDSIVSKQKGDTTIIERHHHHYHTKLVHDTIYNEKPIEVEVIKPVVPQWCWNLVIVNAAVLFIFILYVAFRIAKAIYLRK